MSTTRTTADATAPDPTSLATLATLDSREVLARLGSTAEGLSGSEAAQRLQHYGANEVRGESRSFWGIVRDQLRSGINILLALAGMLRVWRGDLWLVDAAGTREIGRGAGRLQRTRPLGCSPLLKRQPVQLPTFAHMIQIA